MDDDVSGLVLFSHVPHVPPQYNFETFQVLRRILLAEFGSGQPPCAFQSLFCGNTTTKEDVVIFFARACFLPERLFLVVRPEALPYHLLKEVGVLFSLVWFYLRAFWLIFLAF